LSNSELTQDLALAIENGELRLVYQPQVYLATRQVLAWEALSRWSHPRWGEVSPERFIPLAEEHGCIEHLGQWVWQQVKQDLPELLRIAPNSRVAINVSMVELKSPHFFSRLQSLLTDTFRTDSHRLEIELTETAFSGLHTTLVQPFEHLQRLGVTLAMDDFGTGHSDLNRLNSLPFDHIKLDKRFCRALSTATGISEIQMAVALAHRLDIELTAEGVETAEQHQVLLDLGVKRGQGYLYGAPQSLSQWASAR
jgi:EAL domain-containing protein (putative c-di-GMP-specific phosphodiesterase class I)